MCSDICSHKHTSFMFPALSNYSPDPLPNTRWSHCRGQFYRQRQNIVGVKPCDYLLQYPNAVWTRFILSLCGQRDTEQKILSKTYRLEDRINPRVPPKKSVPSILISKCSLNILKLSELVWQLMSCSQFILASLCLTMQVYSTCEWNCLYMRPVLDYGKKEGGGGREAAAKWNLTFHIAVLHLRCHLKSPPCFVFGAFFKRVFSIASQKEMHQKCIKDTEDF